MCEAGLGARYGVSVLPPSSRSPHAVRVVPALRSDPLRAAPTSVLVQSAQAAILALSGASVVSLGSLKFAY